MNYLNILFGVSAVLITGICPAKTPDLQCLTPSGGRQPAFFPDGKRIAYVVETAEGAQNLMVLDIASGKPVRVGQIDSVEKPAVSPEGGGKWILFASGPIFARQLWIVNTANQKSRQIKTGPGICSMHAWSDKGQKVFFTLSGEKGENWMKTDPFKTPQKVEEIKSAGPGKPVWSPSGKFVALVTSNDKGTSSLRILKSDGKKLYDIAPAQSASQTTPPRGCYDPAFSPDERFLIFVRSDIQPMSDLYLLDLKTGSETPLTSDHDDNQSPAFSPDGNSIAFVAAKGGQTHKIYLMKRPPLNK